MNGSVQGAERLSFLRRSISIKKTKKCIALGLVIITEMTRRARKGWVTMSKEKQIEEMVSDLENHTCMSQFQAEIASRMLYQLGYRKQSEGEWVANPHISISKRGRTIHYATLKCSVCGKWNGRKKQKYCPNCGAKMKGGE